MGKDKTVLKCNAREGSPAIAKGALAYVITLKPSRARVLIKSRSRWIDKWVRDEFLENFRLGTIPAEKPIYEKVPDIKALGIFDVDEMNASRPQTKVSK